MGAVKVKEILGKIDPLPWIEQRVRVDVGTIKVRCYVGGGGKERAIVVVVKFAQIASAWRVKDEAVKGETWIVERYERELGRRSCGSGRR